MRWQSLISAFQIIKETYPMDHMSLWNKIHMSKSILSFHKKYLIFLLLQLFHFLLCTFYWNITPTLPLIIPMKAFDMPFNIRSLSRNYPGPLKEFTPMRGRNDQRRFTIILWKYRESQSSSNLSQISIIVSLAVINVVIAFITITYANWNVLSYFFLLENT